MKKTPIEPVAQEVIILNLGHGLGVMLIVMEIGGDTVVAKRVPAWMMGIIEGGS